MFKIPCGGFKLDESSFVLDKETLSTQPVSWDNLKNRPFGEFESSVSMEGENYCSTGYQPGYPEKCSFEPPIPLKLGQVWHVQYRKGSGNVTSKYEIDNVDKTLKAEAIEVKQDMDGNLYLGSLDFSEWPFCIYIDRYLLSDTWQSETKAIYIEVTCVVGTKQVTQIQTIDPKYLPQTPGGGGGGRYMIPLTIDWESSELASAITPAFAVDIEDLVARLNAGEDVVIRYNIGNRMATCSGYVTTIGFESVHKIITVDFGEAIIQIIWYIQDDPLATLSNTPTCAVVLYKESGKEARWGVVPLSDINDT